MTASAAFASLDAKLAAAASPVDMLRNAPSGPYQFPIKAEFSNWRDEQAAWRCGAVLFDQSYHMTDLMVRGKDTRRLITDLAVNSMANWRRDIAKQFVHVNENGHYTGDAIIFILEEDQVNIVNKPNNANWVMYHAEKGGYDVECELDSRALDNTGTRKGYRFEVQGPNGWAILEKLNGGPIEGMKFFGMGEVNIAGRKVRALRHGMAGAAGLELFGPFEDYHRIRDAILEAGEGEGLLAAGSRTYSTVAHESGWYPSPLPAIWSDSCKSYREWLPADGFEGNMSLGGSYVSDKIEDYYLTPYDLGYGHIVKFDHDFIGRSALEEMADQPHKRKRTLVWDKDDVVKVFASMLGDDGDRYKFLDMPASHYATCPYDELRVGGKIVGLSHYPVYTANVRNWISLALLDEAHATPGTQVELTWGEPNGGSHKPAVERHTQTNIKATVTECPISVDARETYKA